MWHNDLNSQQNISMDPRCRISKVHNVLLHVHKNEAPMGTASHPKWFILDSRNALWLTVKREHVPKEALYNLCVVIRINIMQETNSLFVICQKNNSSVVQLHLPKPIQHIQVGNWIHYQKCWNQRVNLVYLMLYSRGQLRYNKTSQENISRVRVY